MNEEIRKMLGEEIKAEIRDLSALESGSKEKSTAIENLATLYKLNIEETKAELDYKDKRERRDMESRQHSLDVEIKKKQIDDDLGCRVSDERLKRDQLSEQVRDRYFRIGIEAASILLPLVFYAAWMRKGFKFEESGTFTSTTFRGLFNRFRPTK